MPLIPEVIDERKLWVILSSRKENCEESELEIIKPLVEKLNERWFEKGSFVWTGRFDDNKTSMSIFETTREKAENYFNDFCKVCGNSLENNLLRWDALPLFTILERIQGKI